MDKFAKLFAVSAAGLMATTAAAYVPYTKADVEAMIRTEPAEGLYNKQWFNYEADILEARREYYSDMARATDLEDRYDALEELHDEVVDADRDYVKEMRERGYRVVRVRVTVEG